MDDISLFIWFPRANILFRSVPKSFMAIPALVPESIASIRCEIGCPISILTPGMAESFVLISARTSDLDLLSSSKGASISETLTPRACSSSSARPVLRATVLISGTDRRMFSAILPTLSDSSSETPGKVLTLMVKEPSLKAGRKLLPRVQNTAIAAASRTATPPKTVLRWDNVHVNAFSYHFLSHLTIAGSWPRLSPFPLPRR